MNDPDQHHVDTGTTCPRCGAVYPPVNAASLITAAPATCVYCGAPFAPAMPTAQPLAPPETGTAIPGAPRLWGFWATMGWSALVIILVQLIAIVLLIPVFAIAMARNPNLDVHAFGRGLVSNGLFLSISTLLTAPACVSLVVLAIRIRRQPIQDYLALHMPRAGEGLKWTAGLAVFIVCSDMLTWLSGSDIVSPFMIDAYQSAGFVPLLFLALMVFAPIWEEIMFRGFMFRGIASSPLGPAGAIVVPSGAWALMHVQYDLYGIGTIFVLGLYLGLVRHKTGSTLMTTILHSLASLVATVELLIVLAHNNQT